MSDSRIYVSYDVEHDGELVERLVEQLGSLGCAFEGASEEHAETGAWLERVRGRIRGVDQMIVICGEHSESSAAMDEELRIAREEDTPYFLIWGRREVMCTKPRGARSAEGIYSWTRSILQDQIAFVVRRAHSDAVAEGLRRKKG